MSALCQNCGSPNHYTHDCSKPPGSWTPPAAPAAPKTLPAAKSAPRPSLTPAKREPEPEWEGTGPSPARARRPDFPFLRASTVAEMEQRKRRMQRGDQPAEELPKLARPADPPLNLPKREQPEPTRPSKPADKRQGGLW